MSVIERYLNSIYITSKIIFVSVLIYFVVMVMGSYKRGAKQAYILSSKLDAVVDSTNSSIQKTTDNTDHLIRDFRYTLVETNRNILFERKMFQNDFPLVIAQTQDVLNNLDVATKDLDPLLKSATVSLQQIQPIEQNADVVLKSLNTTVNNTNVLVTSPSIQDSLVYISKSTSSIADTTKHTDAIMADAQEKVDQWTHPTKKKLGFWGSIMASADVVHRFMPSIF